MILSDKSIKQLCTSPFQYEVTEPIATDVIGMQDVVKVLEQFSTDGSPMISPFVDHAVREDDNGNKIVSYGLSSFGYDVRLAKDFKIFTNVNSAMIDPLDISEECYVNHTGDYVIIPPNSYVLGHTVETFNLPRKVVAICLGKSTYARCGAIVNVTPIEPGFKGQVVIEISNATPLPLKIHAGMGIAQFMFYKGDQDCEVSYDDRKGKYQNQKGLQTALV